MNEKLEYEFVADCESRIIKEGLLSKFSIVRFYNARLWQCLEVLQKEKKYIKNIIPVEDNSSIFKNIETIAEYRDAEFTRREGLSRIDLQNNNIIYLGMIFNGPDGGSYLFGKHRTIKKFRTNINMITRKIASTPIGIYSISTNYDEVNYYDITYKINHFENPWESKIEEDVNHFFKAPNSYWKNFRTSLLLGVPGTGKTTIIQNIAERNKHEYNFSFSSKFSDIVKHMNQAKKSNIPTVCLLEDIDLVEDFKANLHYVINILDGIDTPINKKGTYLILTTNYENEIDPRVLRFGRVDQKIEIGLLDQEFAVLNAKRFLMEFEYNEKDLEMIFSNLTIAEIKIICDRTKKVSYNKGQKITLELLEKVKKEIEKEFSMEIYKFNRKKSVGFTSNLPI